MGGGMPSLPSMGGLPLGALSGLSNLGGMVPNAAGAGAGLAAPMSAAVGAGVSSAAKIPLDQVRYDRQAFPHGREAYVGYIGQALDVMGITDPQQRNNWMRGILTAAERESGFDPLAVNDKDTNATSDARKGPDGHPRNSSRGGVQTIPGTFAAYHQPGTSTNIYDPVANICASMNYVMDRYGVARSGGNLGKVGQFNPGHAAGGY
ncbi:transglycosylase SLT domain-containing protein [Mycobacteroides abscessus subsp. abscessus]|nr:transglycosylase SLT domain-containing protein [Mycobacteroides abscessus]SHW79430.1 transglycosylase SLT domain-containing protein [Mycobacteroides abscessus subsp. abscessus]